MSKTLQEFVCQKAEEKAVSFHRIGGGYYADVYRFDFQNKQTLIIKVYKPKGMMAKEASQIELLSKHAAVSMPRVLWTHLANNSDDGFPQDILAMNYLKGTNAGNVFYISPSKKAKIASQVTDILLSFHNVHNPSGFGEIDCDEYYSTFNEYYKKRAASILKMAEQLHKSGQLASYVLSTAKEAVEKFDKIFYLPITESSLVHGDFNMWNILADKKSCQVTAVIDPCGCMWADSEYDLYQLNNANGKYYKLFETYEKKKSLSENYREKMAFYELFRKNNYNR